MLQMKLWFWIPEPKNDTSCWWWWLRITGRGGTHARYSISGMSRDGYMLGYKTTNLNIAWKLRLSKKAPLLLWFRSFVGQLYILLPPKISTPSSPSAEVIYMPFKISPPPLPRHLSSEQFQLIIFFDPIVKHPQMSPGGLSGVAGWRFPPDVRDLRWHVPGSPRGKNDCGFELGIMSSWLLSLGIWRFLLRYKQVGSTMGPHVAFILPWVWGPR